MNAWKALEKQSLNFSSYKKTGSFESLSSANITWILPPSVLMHLPPFIIDLVY